MKYNNLFTDKTKIPWYIPYIPNFLFVLVPTFFLLKNLTFPNVSKSNWYLYNFFMQIVCEHFRSPYDLYKLIGASCYCVNILDFPTEFLVFLTFNETEKIVYEKYQ